MVDYLLYIDHDCDILAFLKENNPEQYANIDTGEIKYPIVLKDGPIDLLVCKERKTGILFLKIKGSIHKYWNYLNTGQDYNYNDFNINSIEETIQLIKRKYNLSKNGRLVNLEFGLNIETSFSPSEIIDKGILHLKGITHCKKNTYRGTGMFKEFGRYDYWIKIYDKGKQFKLNRYILRLEIKFKRNRAISKHNINSLNDLFNQDSLELLYSCLRSHIEDLTIIDDISPPKCLTARERKLWNIFTNHQRYNEQNISRTAIGVRKKKFLGLLVKHDRLKLKTEILNKMDSKFEELIKVDVFQTCEFKDTSKKIVTHSTKYIGGNRKPDLVEMYCNCSTKNYNKRPEQDIPESDKPLVKKPRNDKSNPRNNLRKKIIEMWCRIQQLLFTNEPIYLTRYQYDLLNYPKWKGTRYDILLFIHYVIVD